MIDICDFQDQFICEDCQGLYHDDQTALAARAQGLCDHCYAIRQAGGRYVAAQPAAVEFVCAQCGMAYDDTASHPQAQEAAICDGCHYEAHPEAYC